MSFLKIRLFIAEYLYDQFTKIETTEAILNATVFNRQLLDRARRVYRRHGLFFTIKKSVIFCSRAVLHWIGKRGLYANNGFIRVVRWHNVRASLTTEDPFRILEVDPKSIQYVTGRGPNPGRFQWLDVGLVQGGKWDESESRFDELPVVQALRDRYDSDQSWEEIDFIRRVIDEADRGRIIWRGCESAKDVREACQRVDRLYKSIKKDGYRSKRVLVEAEEQTPDKFVHGDGLNRYDEVVVDIGRNGEFLFVDGRHRLAIAKILDIDEIPVRVSVRHTGWRKRRELINKLGPSSIPDDLEHHPDLQTV